MPKWLKLFIESSFMFGIGYYVFLRPADYNQSAKHWKELLEFLGIYMVCRFAVEWVVVRWNNYNVTLKEKVNATQKRRDVNNKP